MNQHVLQNTAVAEVVSLTWGIDTNGCVKLNLVARILGCGDLNGLWNIAVVHVLKALDVEGLVAVEAQRLVGLALRELQWNNAHTDEVGAVNTLEGLNDNCLNTKQVGALSSPVTGRTGAVLLTTEDYQRDASFLVVNRRIVDERLWCIILGEVKGVATGDINELVSQTDVSEGTANHDLVVTTTGTQGVVVHALNAVLNQVLSSWGAWLNGGSRGDVVSGDRVAQLHQNASALDVFNWLWLFAHVVEVWCLADVGGIFIPLEGLAFWNIQVAPCIVALEDVSVVSFVHFARDSFLDGCFNLFGGWPDVLQEDIVAVLVLTQSIVFEVEVHGARDSVSDNHDWRSQVVHLHVRGDAAFEVTVTGQNCGCCQVVFVDGVRDLIRQCAGVTNTGGATEAREIEAHCLKVLPQVCATEVTVNNLGTRSTNGLYPWLGLKTELCCLTSNQTSTNHDRWVRGVGTGGDGCNCNHAVVQRVFAAIWRLNDNWVGLTSIGALRSGLALTCAGVVETAGDIVAVFNKTRLGGHALCLVRGLIHHDFVGGVVAQVLTELLLGLRLQDAVLWTLRTSNGRNNGVEVKLEVLGVLSLFSVLLQPHGLSLGVSLNAIDLLLWATGQLEVLNGFLVNWEHCRGRTELRGHVADGCAVSQWDGLNAIAVELYELLDYAVLTQHLGNGQDHVGCGNASWNIAGELEANNLWNQHGNWLTEHCSLSLDAANAPAQNAQAVFHGGVGVGTNTGIWVSQAVVVEDYASEVLNVYLVNNTGSWRNNLEVGEVLCAPTQELVALFVA